MQIVELKDVSKIYLQGLEEIRAVNNLSLTIPQGQFLTIMGASGSGKSTLLHLIGGLDKPTAGEIVLAGQRVSEMTDHQLTLFRRQNLGFIFQFFNLLPTMTAEENILLPLQINGKKVKEYRGQINKLIEMVGLSTRLHHKPRELSGGQMQRVAIARALVHQPSILLADEPTGNLDSKTGEEILSLLREINHQTKISIIMVTHDPKGYSYGQRLVQMKDGAVNLDELNLRDQANLSNLELREAENA